MCSIFDLTQCLLHILPWWLPYVWWGFVGLFVLGVLVKIKELLGWPGLMVIWTLACLGGGILIDRHWELPKQISTKITTSLISNPNAPVPMVHRPVLPPKSLVN